MVHRSLAILRKGDAVLFVQAKDQDYFKLPGGKSEPGEMPIETLHRELSEELGVNVISEKEVGKVNIGALIGGDHPCTIFECAVEGIISAQNEIQSVRYFAK